MRARNPLCPLFLLAALLLGGCASPRMKGTPFFTGEYEVRNGPAEDRVNLWPLLYYRDPALSVLWPLAEWTDTHFALRPVLSVYGQGTDERQINLLWPLAQFDEATQTRRVFPLFWGEDYVVVFPLFWHRGDPFGDAGGHNGLLPLWWHNTDSRGACTDVLWPIVQVKRRGSERGWRVWPLAGHSIDGAAEYRFLLWPLGHQWRNEGKNHGHAVFPLYGLCRDGEGRLFVSLPYSSRRRDDNSGWQLVPPLFYRSFDTEQSLVVSPLYAAARRRNGARGWSLAFPLFFHAFREEDSTFLSLPWMTGRRGDQSAWQMAPPLVFHRRTPDDRLLLTPLFGRGTRSDGTRAWHAVAPLYYRRTGPEGNLLVTPAGGFETDAQGRRWLLYPLLSGGRKDKEGGEIWLVAPLFHAEWDAQSTSHHLVPVYYWNGESGVFVSPLAARWTDGHGRKLTLAPPLLSLLRQGDRQSDLWFLAGMGKASWGDTPGARYLAPLAYSNPRTGTFLSPLWAAWEDNGVDYRLLPLLLSGSATHGQTTDVAALLGLFHHRFTPDPAFRRGHLLPLYAYEGNKALVTPLFGWNKDSVNGFVYPLTPLAGWRTGRYRGGWFFPLVSHKTDRAADRTEGTFLWGRYWKRGDRGGSSLFPLYTYRNDGPIDTDAPEGVRHATYGKHAAFLPACWYRDQLHIRPVPGAERDAAAARVRRTRFREHGFFPLWHYTDKTSPQDVRRDTSGSVLLLLYDYRRTVRPDPEHPAQPGDDYARARILWRLWHYERSNGDVSVDVFPGITYDSRKSGFMKFSFLWRAFRYERNSHGTSLDLLFLPLRRPAPDRAPRNTPSG